MACTNCILLVLAQCPLDRHLHYGQGFCVIGKDRGPYRAFGSRANHFWTPWGPSSLALLMLVRFGVSEGGTSICRAAGWIRECKYVWADWESCDWCKGSKKNYQTVCFMQRGWYLFTNCPSGISPLCWLQSKALLHTKERACCKAALWVRDTQHGQGVAS